MRTYRIATSREIEFGDPVPAAGKIEIDGIGIETRDGAAIRDDKRFRITAVETAEIVLVDVA